MFADAPTYSSFAVDDIDRAREFYGDTLGVEVRTFDEVPGGMLVLALAGGNVLVYPKEDHVPAVFTVLNFEVDDVEQAVDGLVERGVTMQRYEGFDQDEKGIARAMGPPIAWFEDPSGNIVAVIESDSPGSLLG